MEKMLQEFIAFAKDKFGVDVKVSESDAPDSFEYIFGRSFLDEDNQYELEDFYSGERLLYMNDSVSFASEFYMQYVDCNITEELELAA